MPEEVQANMEHSFGEDFSDVQIHDNSTKAEDLGAKAFTQGKDVHFAPGEFQPDSKEGQELIGHELTHVVQQKECKVHGSEVHGKKMVNQDPALEKEADDAGKLASEGKEVKVSGMGSGVMRKKKNDQAYTDALKRIEAYDIYIQEASLKYGVAVDKIKSIIGVESEGFPEVSSGAAFGLMQITKVTWNGIINDTKFPELKSFDFESYKFDPRANILVGTATFKEKMRIVNVSPENPNFATIAVVSYNAGEFTVKYAMELAREAGSENPTVDFIKPEFMKPAIKKYYLYTYYFNLYYKTGPKGKRVEDTEKIEKEGGREKVIEKCINLKYNNEISIYPGEVSEYINLLSKEGKTESGQSSETEGNQKSEQTENVKSRTDLSGTSNFLAKNKTLILSGSVGIGCDNNLHDVIAVQNKLLYFRLISEADLIPDNGDVKVSESKLGKIIEGINKFQKVIFNGKSYGKIIPNKETVLKLNSLNLKEFDDLNPDKPSSKIDVKNLSIAKRDATYVDSKINFIHTNVIINETKLDKNEQNKYKNLKDDNETLQTIYDETDGDYEELGMKMRLYAPYNPNLVIAMLNFVSDHNRDDLVMEIIGNVSDSELAKYNPSLLDTFAKHLSDGYVGKDEKAQILRIDHAQGKLSDENTNSNDKSHSTEILDVIDSKNFFRNESDYQGCKRACDAILKKAGIDPSLDPKRTDIGTLKEKNGVNELTHETKKGVEVINEYLESNNPITVGVDYKFGTTYNTDHTTDHFIIITGRGVEQDGRIFYHFWDVIKNDTKSATSKTNKLYLDVKTGQLVGKSEQWPSVTYTVSLVRPNIKR
jgi:antitoxin component HigA of HigAB toxin-antitoxin module